MKKTPFLDYILFFKPRPGFVVTPVLIDINIIVFSNGNCRLRL